jgi:hypothetical protein
MTMGKINWSNVGKGRNFQTMHAGHYRDDIRREIIGIIDRGEKLEVSDILRAPRGLRELTYQVADGYVQEGKSLRRDAEARLYGDQKFVLRVLNGQAVSYYDDEGILQYRNFDYAPKQGDVVRWEIGEKTFEEYPSPLSAQARNDLHGRGIDYVKYAEYTVDQNICISVPFAIAYEMLREKGKRIASVEWNKPRAHEKDREGKPLRKICNWLFEEVTTTATLKEQGKK